MAALSVTNLGGGLADLFDSVYDQTGDDPLGLVAGAEDLGLSLPGDLRTLLGEETVAAVLGEESFALRARTRDVDAAYRTAETIVGTIGTEDVSSLLRRLDDGIAVGTDPEALDAVSGRDGGLGRSEAFTKAVPDAEQAGLLLYVDVAQARRLTGESVGKGEADLARLQSVGLTSSGDLKDGTFRLRVTVRD